MAHPAKAAGDAITHLEFFIIRRFDNADHGAVHRLAQRQSGGIAVARQSSAHAGINRMKLRADQNVVFTDVRQRHVFEPEIIELRLALGPRS